MNRPSAVLVDVDETIALAGPGPRWAAPARPGLPRRIGAVPYGVRGRAVLPLNHDRPG